MIKKLMALSAAVVLIFAACKKNQSDSEKILGRWKVESSLLVDVNNGVTVSNTYTGQPSDYIDFRTDGKVYTSVNGNLDTSFYSVANSRVTFTDNNPPATVTVFDIRNLSNSTLQLYNKNVISPTHYVESTANLKK